MVSPPAPPRPNRANTATVAKKVTSVIPSLPDDAAGRDDEMWELVTAHIMDVMENGNYNDRMAIINKFGPVLMRKKDGQDVAIDVEAVRAEVRGWIEQTGRSFFND